MTCGTAFRKYDHTVSRWKPSRPVLVALAVLHMIVTAITLRDLYDVKMIDVP